jgi:hypothetical protein
MNRQSQIKMTSEERTLPASVFDFRLIPPFC